MVPALPRHRESMPIGNTSCFRAKPQRNHENLDLATPGNGLFQRSQIAPKKCRWPRLLYVCRNIAMITQPTNPDLKEEWSMKTGRNDPCPCGSGKKFKKCCLGKTPRSAALSPDARPAHSAVSAASQESPTWSKPAPTGNRAPAQAPRPRSQLQLKWDANQ